MKHEIRNVPVYTRKFLSNTRKFLSNSEADCKQALSSPQEHLKPGVQNSQPIRV